MTEDTNAQVIAWSNGRMRPIVNAIDAVCFQIDQYITDYGTQGIAALINQVGAGEIIQDGSDTDGRPQVTGTQIENLEAALLQLQTAAETTLVSGVGVTVKFDCVSHVYADQSLRITDGVICLYNR